MRDIIDREITPHRRAAIITMRELGYQFKDIKICTGVAISTASDIHCHAIKSLIAKWEGALSTAVHEAELQEVWESPGFGLIGENEGFLAEEMNQVEWRRDMRTRDKDNISLCVLLAKDCLNGKPCSEHLNALTDAEIDHLFLTVKRDFRTRRMCLVDMRRGARLSHVSDSTVWKTLRSRRIRAYNLKELFKFILKSKNQVIRLKYCMEQKD